MPDKDQLLANIITVANIVELIKQTINKVGLEFIAPLTESIQDEKISKAILTQVKGEAK